jgi:hypothetical protein
MSICEQYAMRTSFHVALPVRAAAAAASLPSPFFQIHGEPGPGLAQPDRGSRRRPPLGLAADYYDPEHAFVQLFDSFEPGASAGDGRCPPSERMRVFNEKRRERIVASWAAVRTASRRRRPTDVGRVSLMG